MSFLEKLFGIQPKPADRIINKDIAKRLPTITTPEIEKQRKANEDIMAKLPKLNPKSVTVQRTVAEYQQMYSPPMTLEESHPEMKRRRRTQPETVQIGNLLVTKNVSRLEEMDIDLLQTYKLIASERKSRLQVEEERQTNLGIDIKGFDGKNSDEKTKKARLNIWQLHAEHINGNGSEKY